MLLAFSGVRPEEEKLKLCKKKCVADWETGCLDNNCGASVINNQKPWRVLTGYVRRRNWKIGKTCNNKTNLKDQVVYKPLVL